METLGQDRMRSLKTNYRRNKIKLTILSSLALLLLIYAGLIAWQIHRIKTEVIAENTHYITQAQAEMETSDAIRSEARTRYEEAKARNAAIQAEIDALKNAN